MNKKAIIVWSSSGIWEQLAKDLVDNWYTVWITWRRIKLLEKIHEYNTDKIKFKSFDIEDTETTIKNLNELIEKIWGLDLLILSAGTWKINPKLDFKIENKTIKTNALGWTNIIIWITKKFIKQWFWNIVAITSVSALRWSSSCPSYNATKSYQSNYLESIRLYIDQKKIPIDILEVQPWFIKTRMAQWNLFRASSVKKASKQILKAIKTKKKHIYVSKKRILIAWLMRILPYNIYKIIVRSV